MGNGKWIDDSINLATLDQAGFGKFVSELRERWRTQRIEALEAVQRELLWLKNGAREKPGVSSPLRWQAGAKRSAARAATKQGLPSDADARGHAMSKARIRSSHEQGIYIGLLSKARYSGKARVAVQARKITMTKGRAAAVVYLQRSLRV